MSDTLQQKLSADHNDSTEKNTISRHFIQQFIDEDIAESGQYAGQTVHTRFPPEPNGYLHIGHAKAICINFGLADEYHGLCNLRMDDTNPVKEDVEYVHAIQEDIRWLGFDWADRFHYASDYFPFMYEAACHLIKQGLAYVCDLSGDEVRQMRGTLTEPGQNSPYRDRSVEENLDLFERMKKGEFPDGSRTLRAKIDMASGNMNMRDPVIYRISHTPHHRSGTTWCIYPMYDFAHPIEDGLEGITHSLCSIEFEDHRPLYDWVVEHCDLPSKPRQIEFARLGMNYTVMSKRKLLELVQTHAVDGWDDPRMPTLSGLRRRGYTPESIRTFIKGVGVSKVPNTVDYAYLEHCIREDLNETADRRMAVLDPIPLTITNYPDDQIETLVASNHPQKTDTRNISFSKHLWIDSTDFMIEPPKKYFRLYPGNEVRLMHAYIVKCTGYDVDEQGKVTHVYAEYDPSTKGGNAPEGKKIKGTIHWVDQTTAVDADIALYNNLFTVEDPDKAEEGYAATINPESLVWMHQAKLESALKDAPIGKGYQFVRHGYFCKDSHDHGETLIFNRTVSLKDSFKLPK